MDVTTWKSEWSDGQKAIEGLKALIKAVPDFPKKGINFRDIMPIFQVPLAVQAVVDLMSAYIEVHYSNVDVIVGLDARGFLIGPMIAVSLSKPFVPVRKQGKLPGSCISAKSVKEYGQDILELQCDAIKKGQNVVVIDDLLATGGTMATTNSLIGNAGGIVIGCLCIIELSDLNGRKKFDAPFHALLQY